MYFVVRTDRPLAFGQGMALAGAATDAALQAAPADRAWLERPRKVALRADAEAFEALRERAGACVEDALLCLAPMRTSERPAVLAELRPFTDARRPPEPPGPPADGPALLYVIRPGVLKTLGKAMAQAGHAAQLAAAAFDLGAWRSAGRPGEVRMATGEDAWAALRARDDAVAVADAGLTQVAAGTETVLGLAPGSDAAAGLERVP